MSAQKPVDLDLAELRRRTAEGGSRRFWSSIDELLDQESFRRWLEAEFPAAAAAFHEPGRRQFLKLMGASLLLGGLTACKEGASDRALPYVTAPEAIVPGVPRYYASAVTLGGYAQPVLATTYDGRPTKLDGNPEHPATHGRSDAFMQAGVLDLYDPDRSQTPVRGGVPSTWARFEADLVDLRARWKADGGAGLRIVIGPTTSPTVATQLDALAARWPAAKICVFDPLEAPAQAQAMQTAFGRAAELRYRLDRCDVIVSLDDDLLGPGPFQVRHAGQWAARRGDAEPGKGRARLHVAESVPGLSGAVASTRLPCDASRLNEIARAIGAEFGLEGWDKPNLSERERLWVARAVAELREHAGSGLICASPHLPPAVQAMAARINEALHNVGTTVDYYAPMMFRPAAAITFAALVEEMAADKVDTLIVLDANPVYGGGDARLEQAMPRVRERIHLGLHWDETAGRSRWHLPLTHPLESWGDARAVDGTATIMQPTIRPLYATRSVPQVLDMLAGVLDPAPDAAVRETWRRTFADEFDARWTASLHDGFVADSAPPPLTVSVGKTPVPPATPGGPEGDVDIVFKPDPCVWDGRFANIAWLQELPKPLTKITWDNVVAISPALAARYKIGNGDAVQVMIDKRKLTGPAWVVPGQAPNTVALFLGYGRREGGDVARDVGYDAYALRSPVEPWLARGTLTRVEGAKAEIATTQAHHRMDGFDFVREVTAKEPRTAPPKDAPTLYPEVVKASIAWGMVIDLDTCIGCNACVAACNVENNVLVVGKEQVALGREMQWLRVDRYYTGDIEDPRSYFQPVPCMHCEKAPCEMGCPVHATVHSAEGLNQMVYNRCIGTRTCSSYCPYKVRRFNWYDYRKRDRPGDAAAKNPDVTVRSRGVMEKCTYCVQRIEAAHVAADKDGRPIRTGEVVTACQQACPTQAIAFGDLNDAESEVAKRRKSGRHYALLEELGTRPRTTYLARWNDDPDAGGEGGRS